MVRGSAESGDDGTFDEMDARRDDKIVISSKHRLLRTDVHGLPEGPARTFEQRWTKINGFTVSETPPGYAGQLPRLVMKYCDDLGEDATDRIRTTELRACQVGLFSGRKPCVR